MYSDKSSIPPNAEEYEEVESEAMEFNAKPLNYAYTSRREDPKKRSIRMSNGNQGYNCNQFDNKSDIYHDNEKLQYNNQFENDDSFKSNNNSKRKQKFDNSESYPKQFNNSNQFPSWILDNSNQQSNDFTKAPPIKEDYQNDYNMKNENSCFGNSNKVYYNKPMRKTDSKKNTSIITDNIWNFTKEIESSSYYFKFANNVNVAKINYIIESNEEEPSVTLQCETNVPNFLGIEYTPLNPDGDSLKAVWMKRFNEKKQVLFKIKNPKNYNVGIYEKSYSLNYKINNDEKICLNNIKVQFIVEKD